MPQKSGYSFIPPIDPSLPGYDPMGGFSTDPTSYATSIGSFGTSKVKAPGSGQGSHASSVLKAVQNVGPGSQDPASPMSKLLGNIGTGVGIFADLAGVWQGFQQQKLAKKAFQTQLAFANANLENTVKDYNTRRMDTLQSRGFTQGDSAAATQQAINASSLNFRRI